MIQIKDGNEWCYTVLKEADGRILYEVEVLGMVFYETVYPDHDRITRDYNYFEALLTFNKL